MPYSEKPQKQNKTKPTYIPYQMTFVCNLKPGLIIHLLEVVLKYLLLLCGHKQFTILNDSKWKTAYSCQRLRSLNFCEESTILSANGSQNFPDQ